MLSVCRLYTGHYIAGYQYPVPNGTDSKRMTVGINNGVGMCALGTSIVVASYAVVGMRNDNRLCVPLGTRHEYSKPPIIRLGDDRGLYVPNAPIFKS